MVQDTRPRKGPTIEQRRANLAHAVRARRKQGLDTRIAAVAERADELTDDQRETLRALADNAVVTS